jgi:hypothetical protein
MVAQTYLSIIWLRIFWNMVVGSSMYGCDPIMVAPSENTVASHICAIVKYGCITYSHVDAGLK